MFKIYFKLLISSNFKIKIYKIIIIYNYKIDYNIFI
jgi:hypothetical protein